MKGEVDPCVRVGILSASPLPRGAAGTDASSWVVEAKVGMSVYLFNVYRSLDLLGSSL